MKQPKKITVNVPEELLSRAQRSTGRGITQTITQGLELLAAADTFDRIRSLRGKIKYSLDLAELRKDD